MVCSMALSAFAEQAMAQASPAISGNPAATDYSIVGTGWLGRTLGLKDEWGIRLGGLWLADANLVAAGGAVPGGLTANQALFIGLHLDAYKLVDWKGASFGFQFMQFNGSDVHGTTNEQAGTVTGYNSIIGTAPYNRTELLEAWYLQEMIKDVLSMRIGRVVPTYDFGNVLRPVALADVNQNIPAVSGLLWTPVFVNTSMIGVMMGYYNPANGITVNFSPTKSFYVNLGAYDGNRGHGIETGLNPPMFNGYWFNIGEVGVNWTLGQGNHPGQFGIGLWRQTGLLTAHGITEDGTGGFYLFGSQRLVRDINPKVDNSSISMFYQFGANASQTLPFTQYYGAGLTAFSPLGDRPSDSVGVGVSLSRLNPNIFQQTTELMFQAYYQAHVINSIFLQPTVTYVPTPGLSPTTPAALTTTLRLTMLF
jgi:porin